MGRQGVQTNGITRPCDRPEMARREVVKVLGLSAAGLAAAGFVPAQVPDGHRDPLDLSGPADNLKALLKMRADLSGAQVTWWMSGSIHSFVPGERSRHLFGFEGFSSSRIEPFERGWRLYHRELAVFKDPDSGRILERWLNPFLGREVEVVPRLNDPVNVELPATPGAGPFAPPFPYLENGDDVWFNMDLFFLRPSPITREEFPLNVQSDLYQGAELYIWHVRRSDLEDPGLSSAPATCGWTRLGQWEPFMEMGNRPGILVFHAAAKKLMNGAEGLPAAFRRWVEQNQPRFLTAPTEFSTANESQWTLFKKLMESRRREPSS